MTTGWSSLRACSISRSGTLECATPGRPGVTDPPRPETHAQRGPTPSRPGGFLRRTTDSYRIDETYVRVGGAWHYLYRGVDSNGDTLDFLLRATRDRNAAIAFFRKTVGASHTTPPRVVNVDKNPAYPIAVEAIKHEGFFRPRSSLRHCKYLNNVIEQDHRFIKRRTRPMLGFKRFTTAWRTVRGIEIMHALRKGQARWMAKGDVVGQTRLIHKVFGLAV